MTTANAESSPREQIGPGSRSRRGSTSPLNAPAWRLLLVVVLGCAATWAVHRIFPNYDPSSTWLIALLAGITWLSAARFLFLDTAWRRVWLVILLLGLVALVAFVPDAGGRHIALTATCFFLIFRGYRPYGHLTSGRRTLIFALGFLAFAAVTFGVQVPRAFEPEAGGWLHALGFHIARYSIDALRIFWFLSLAHIFFRMRLHSWRLKPKLAASALFLALVPLALLVAFALLSLVSMLGGSRATRGRAILADWSQMAAAGVHFSGTHFDSSFTLQMVGDQPHTRGSGPSELDAFLARLAGEREPEGDAAVRAAALPDSAAGMPAGAASGVDSVISATRDSLRNAEPPPWSPADTAAYFVLGSEIWLLRLQGVSGNRSEISPAAARGAERATAPSGSPAGTGIRIDGYRLNGTSLDRLATMLGCDVGIYVNPDLSVQIGSQTVVREVAEDSSGAIIDIRGRRQPADGSAAATDEGGGLRLRFGAALVDVIRLAPDRLRVDQAILHLETTPRGLIGEYVRGENVLLQAVIWVLAVIAVLFLIVEGFALFLGIRITGGITSAVAALHRGTLRLARGDLETRIHIPNQDEFGDLADSFNDMTVAVKRGREEAVARERLERELETARQIQERLLPREIPTVPGFEICGTSVPSRQVGGDYFDMLPLEEGQLGIAIGDVSGKGMPAALLMSNLQASLQGQVIHPSSVADVVRRINDLLARSTDPHMFATFFYGVLDPAKATFTAANAGHNPPILHRVDGTIELIEAGGLILGMLPGQTYRQQTVELAPGDVLVLYTDGITEATAGPGVLEGDGEPPAGVARGAAPGGAQEPDEDPDRMFGEERLQEVVRGCAGRGADCIKDEILAAVERYAAGTPQSDDITLVVLKRLPPD